MIDEFRTNDELLSSLPSIDNRERERERGRGKERERESEGERGREQVAGDKKTKNAHIQKHISVSQECLWGPQTLTKRPRLRCTGVGRCCQAWPLMRLPFHEQ